MLFECVSSSFCDIDKEVSASGHLLQLSVADNWQGLMEQFEDFFFFQEQKNIKWWRNITSPIIDGMQGGWAGTSSEYISNKWPKIPVNNPRLQHKYQIILFCMLLICYFCGSYVSCRLAILIIFGHSSNSSFIIIFIFMINILNIFEIHLYT